MRRQIIVIFAIILSILIVKFSLTISLVISCIGGLYTLLETIGLKKWIDKYQREGIPNKTKLPDIACRDALKDNYQAALNFVLFLIIAITVLLAKLGHLTLNPFMSDHRIYWAILIVLVLVLILLNVKNKFFGNLRLEELKYFVATFEGASRVIMLHAGVENFINVCNRYLYFLVAKYNVETSLFGPREKPKLHAWILLPDPQNKCYRSLTAVINDLEFAGSFHELSRFICPDTYRGDEEEIKALVNEIKNKKDISEEDKRNQIENLVKGSATSYVHRNGYYRFTNDLKACKLFNKHGKEAITSMNINSAIGVPIQNGNYKLGTLWLFSNAYEYFSVTNYYYTALVGNIIGNTMYSCLTSDKISGSQLLSHLRGPEVGPSVELSGIDYVNMVNDMYKYPDQQISTVIPKRNRFPFL